MTTFKCNKCKKSFNDGVTFIYICFVCERVMCGCCTHSHVTFEKNADDSFKQIIKDKGKFASDLMVSFYGCTELGYPINRNYEGIDFDAVSETRKLIKQYVDLKCMGLLDYRLFNDDLLKMKIKFKYGLYKILLLDYFCCDVTETILSFL